MRIALLVGRGRSSAILVNAIRKRFPAAELLVIEEDPPSKLAMIRYRRRKLGAMIVFGQLLFQVFALPIISRRSKRRTDEIMREFKLDAKSIERQDVISVPSVNSRAVAEELPKFCPNVVLVNGTRIIKPGILECVDACFINTHVGITPMYRGVHGGYWALWNSDDDNFGVTLHIVDPGVDTGQPLRQVRCRPSKNDTFATYPLLQQAHALGAIEEIISQMPGSLVTKEEKTGGQFSRQWYHPTILQYFAGRLRGIR